MKTMTNLIKLSLLSIAAVGVGALLWACEDPKHPVPCTGTEQWPDPCASAKRDGGLN